MENKPNKSKKQFDRFLEKHKDAEPREYLVRAIEHIKHRGTALDIGAGTLRDTKLLLSEGFEKVIAIDAHERLQQFSSAIDNPKLETHIVRFNDFTYEPGAYDLVNAQYSLPFMRKTLFEGKIKEIIASIKPDGVFVGTFFGLNDQTNTPEYKLDLFHTEEQIREIFSGFTILELYEKEREVGSSCDGKTYRHSFHVTAKKL
jgi:tellurite methyltransferase